MEIIDKVINFLGNLIFFGVMIWLIVNKIFNLIFEKLSSYGFGK